MSLPIRTFPRDGPFHYEVLRPKIRTGDILLCSGIGIYSRLIKKATESIWSHVAIVVRKKSVNRIMVHEAVESIGVRTVPLSLYIRNYEERGKGYPGRLVIARHEDFVKTSRKELEHLSNFALANQGYPYDKDEILRIVSRIGLGRVANRRRELVRDREYICSEFAWECFQRVGITIPIDGRGFVAPRDFASAGKVSLVGVLLGEDRSVPIAESARF